MSDQEPDPDWPERDPRFEAVLERLGEIPAVRAIWAPGLQGEQADVVCVQLDPRTPEDEERVREACAPLEVRISDEGPGFEHPPWDLDDPVWRERIEEWHRRAAEEGPRIDHRGAPRPKVRWMIFKGRYAAELDALDRAYLEWHSRARVEAGLPPLPTEEGRTAFGAGFAPPDPELEAAIRRLDRLPDRVGVRGHGWSLEEPRVVRVWIDPYRERGARRVREALLPFEARVEPERNRG